MAGKFDLKKSTNGKFYFNLKAGNGQVILTGEMYESKSGATNGIDSVKRNAADDKRFERKETAKGEFYFVLKAGNGEQIGRSENYSTAAAMENGIESVKENAPTASTEDNGE
ncbi:MAG: YegP family protein [Pyrinomonadaceae bacterium]